MFTDAHFDVLMLDYGAMCSQKISVKSAYPFEMDGFGPSR